MGCTSPTITPVASASITFVATLRASTRLGPAKQLQLPRHVGFLLPLCRFRLSWKLMFEPKAFEIGIGLLQGGASPKEVKEAKEANP